MSDDSLTLTSSAPSSCCVTGAGPRSTSPVEVQVLALDALLRSPHYGATQGMKLLEAGTFLMGYTGPEAWVADGEGPVREIELAPFWIDVNSVTNAQFEEFINATSYATEAEKFGWSYVFHRYVSGENKQRSRGFSGEANWWLGVEGAFWKRPEGPGSNIKKRMDHPVVHVSWNDAQAYCAWVGKQLPTEAQWEYAARGGLVQKLYPWGDELTPKGKNGKPQHMCNIWQGKFPDFNSGADGYETTAPAKSFAANGFGLYNLSGNVWEWCSDWFSPSFHRSGPRQNPLGPPEGTHKVTKGGSYLCHASYCNRYRLAARTGNTPDSTTSHTGFRCVRSVE